MLKQIFMNSIPADLRKQLDDASQAHLLKFWDAISDIEKQSLLSQISRTDLKMMRKIWQSSMNDDSPQDAIDRIESAQKPEKVIQQPQTTADFESWKQAAVTGEQELRSGRVAVITVAGGQGSRLSFEHPKGMFPIGPKTERTLFQIFAEQILARRRRHNAAIPWLIMTSDATHAETLRFLEQYNYFQLDKETVHLFQQGSLPALDAATGHILMSSRSELALSPDGHGGLVEALANAGLLKILASRDIRHLFYHQVDNPTAILCDPALIGFHANQRSQLTTNVVRKVSPTERMGVLADVNGRTEIVEYSELTPEQAARCDANGDWVFWAGNTAIHVFDRKFVEQLAGDGGQLPLHVARKNVAFVNDDGATVKPDDPARPNAIKLERFIFDALPIADRTLIVEGDRAREFNPVKNRDGADSPETSRAALSRIGRDWLTSAGQTMAEDCSVEISPLVALDAEELAVNIASHSIRVSDLL
jgi:UDP-N-acetylglucosamine/UDP-N-acetylgalactosamine diphosphorylase